MVLGATKRLNLRVVIRATFVWIITTYPLDEICRRPSSSVLYISATLHVPVSSHPGFFPCRFNSTSGLLSGTCLRRFWARRLIGITATINHQDCRPRHCPIGGCSSSSCCSIVVVILLRNRHRRCDSKTRKHCMSRKHQREVVSLCLWHTNTLVLNRAFRSKYWNKTELVNMRSRNRLTHIHS